jgi:hypothetical protein
MYTFGSFPTHAIINKSTGAVVFRLKRKHLPSCRKSRVEWGQSPFDWYHLIERLGNAFGEGMGADMAFCIRPF